MSNMLFSEESAKRMTSPEQLNDYLRVTKPAVWVVLLAVAALLVGMLIWAFFVNIGSYVNGSAEVKDGTMTVTFADAAIAHNVSKGMVVEADNASAVINEVRHTDDGGIQAIADTSLTDGTYPARVCYNENGLIGILFGN